jgi:hypothetical protein
MMTAMRYFSLRTLLACFVASFFFLAGCNSIDPVDDLQEPQIAFDKGDSKANCSGEILFSPAYTVVPVSDYPGFDLAIQLSGSATGIPPGCGCGTTTYTLDLDLDYMFVKEVGVTSSFDQSMNVELVYEDANGFAIEFRAPDGWNEIPQPVNGQGGNNFSVCVDAADGDIILFDFYGGTPGGPNSSSVIEYAGGICIVDNIAKTNGQ